MSGSAALKISLMHGWGFDASLWSKVLPLLQPLDVEVADMGYFAQALAPVPRRNATERRIAVGHSLGAAWWLTQTQLDWQALVIINGFTRFTATTDFPHGVAPRVLKRMQLRFKSDSAAKVLADFHLTCGAGLVSDSGSPFPPLPEDTQALAAGLESLSQIDGRLELAQRQPDIWVLASRDDQIVPAAMSAAAFSGLPSHQFRWVEDGNHVLPISQPQACAALIRAAANA